MVIVLFSSGCLLSFRVCRGFKGALWNLLVKNNKVMFTSSISHQNDPSVSLGLISVRAFSSSLNNCSVLPPCLLVCRLLLLHYHCYSICCCVTAPCRSVEYCDNTGRTVEHVLHMCRWFIVIPEGQKATGKLWPQLQ